MPAPVVSDVGFATVGFATAGQVAGLIRRAEVSSREVTESMFARIDAVNPAVNAVVEQRREQALVEAAAADAAIAAGVAVGPLHGVPMTIKDSFNVAGLHTTWGNPTFRDFLADTDAVVAQRLRSAGAIIVGKTNVHFMLADFGQTANDVYGVTNNPWDLARSPGGSTGGGAAALAAGLTYLEYGSDLVGSIRIPASFCGVYGLKPTAEIVPLAGFAPPGPPALPNVLQYLSAVGPLARSAGDLRTALTVTAGPEVPASLGFRWRLAPPRHRRLADFRVGVVLDHPDAPVSSEVSSVLAGAVDALAKAGARIVPGWPAGIDPSRDHESFGFQVGLFFAFQEQTVAPPSGPEFAPLSAVIAQQSRRMAVRAAWSGYFSDIDVFLCPANFTPAFPHDDRPFEQRTIATPEGSRPYAAQSFWVSHASLAGLPAVVAPVGRTMSGLPVGAQIVGPAYEDDTAITFAELLGDVIGGYEIPAAL